MKTWQKASLAILLPVVFITGAAFGNAFFEDWFEAIDYYVGTQTATGRSVFSRAGVYFNDELNTFRMWGGNDSFNMGSGSDIFHLSSGPDVLAFGGSGVGFPGEGDIISFDKNGDSTNAYINSRNYIRSSGYSDFLTDPPLYAELELRANNVRVSSNSTGDVIIVLGRTGQ